MKREVPYKMKALEALLRRIKPNHPKIPEIEMELGKYKAGYKGEQSLDYYLDFLPDDEYLILHGLRLPFKHYYFQIDTLLLSKTFFLLIEVKNFAGHVIFNDSFKQLIRVNKETGEKEAFKDPVKQVELQKFQFSNVLKNLKIPSIPIEHLVVFTNPNTLLQATTEGKVYSDRIITAQQLLFKIEDYKRRYNREKLEKKELRKLARLLMKKHEPPRQEILQIFELKKSDLINGALCPKCLHEPMLRVPRCWECPQCKIRFKNAHLDALQDYSLLINPLITRREMQEYLRIPSEDIAYRLLKSLNLKTQGEKKNRKYILEFKQ